MTCAFSARAWECAAAQQAVAVLVAMQRGPDAADPCMVALAAQMKLEKSNHEE